MSKPAQNIAASIRQQLANHARENRQNFQTVLFRYGVERLLYRIGVSAHGDRFVLKGATLFVVWGAAGHRPTRDLDLLGFGNPEVEAVCQDFREIVAVEADGDGIVFHPETVQGEAIRKGKGYRGVRLRLQATLDGAKIPLQVDVGFGDAVMPQPKVGPFPTILDLPFPQVKIYPREVVVAEKFEAMVALGDTNSRMKDFFDLWTIARSFAFSGQELRDAMAATFARRGTALPTDLPIALTPAYTDDAKVVGWWSAFLSKVGHTGPSVGLADVAAELVAFLMPIAAACRSERPFASAWQPGGPWK